MEAWDYVLATIAIIAGIIFCFTGYAIFTPFLASVGFFLGFYVTYTALMSATKLALVWVILIAVAAGIAMGIFTKIFWKVGVFLAGAIAGFLFGNFIQNTETDGLIGPTWGLWLMLGIMMLIMGSLAVFFVRPVVIVVTAFCGAFGIMAGADVFIGERVLFGLDFVHLEKHARDPSVDTWVVWLFYGVWGLLTFVGIIVQALGPLSSVTHSQNYPEDQHIVLISGKKKGGGEEEENLL